jgi:MoaA/NifB/PqqE/SkfB family radical SAM enzyme
MIRNARLLDEAMAVKLIDAGLDSIVISADGTTTQTKDPIRAGTPKPQAVRQKCKTM